MWQSNAKLLLAWNCMECMLTINPKMFMPYSFCSKFLTILLHRTKQHLNTTCEDWILFSFLTHFKKGRRKGREYRQNRFITYTKRIPLQETIITIMTVKLQSQYIRLLSFTTTVQCKLKLLIPDDNRWTLGKPSSSTFQTRVYLSHLHGSFQTNHFHKLVT